MRFFACDGHGAAGRGHSLRPAGCPSGFFFGDPKIPPEEIPRPRHHHKKQDDDRDRPFEAEARAVRKAVPCIGRIDPENREGKNDAAVRKTEQNARFWSHGDQKRFPYAAL